MNNYKLIENRPELTSSQVLGGMNFALVSAGALASTTTIAGVIITKGLITKCFIAAVVVSSAVMMYNKDNTVESTEGKEGFTSNSVSEPNNYGEKAVVLEETAQVVTTSLKPIRIIIPTIAPTNATAKKNIESKTETENESISNTTSTTTAPITNIMSLITMPTIALNNPGSAVCQPGPNSIHKNPPINKLVKDSVK